MKSYTDLPQSQKLTEFLPLKSADMYYQYALPKSDKIRYNPIVGNPIDALEWYNKGYTHFGKNPLTLNEYCIPCWSLAALVEVLPKFIGDYGKCLYYDVGGYYCEYMDDGNFMLTIQEIKADNSVDACVEMIIKLHEQELL